VCEEIFPGGNLNRVARVGDTVRRATGPWTPAVHQLLKHLEEQAFDAAPRVLGFDEQGREVLSFIEGATDNSADPAWVWSDRALVQAGRLIRRYHDVCRSFEPPADAQWQVMVGAPTDGEIICHNDLAPFNTVYRDGVPQALLDWDLAAPSPPLWDVAYAAWRFVPLYSDPTAAQGREIDVADRAARLRLFCDAYGLADEERAGLVEMIDRRIRCAFDTLKAWGEGGVSGWAEMWRARIHGDGMLRDLAFIAHHRDVFADALA